MRALFVTGASGFVGRHVLAAADRVRYGRVVALSRRPPPPADAAGAEWVTAALADAARYRSVLGPGTDVLHLAAATGAATAAQHAAANVDGTTALLAACADKGCRRFVFVSSIAAGWPDDPHYPYAQTKRAAETLVKRSELRWTIARATIVLGAGSPIWKRLRSLATAPVGVLIGDGRVKIQPVLAPDLARMLLEVPERDELAGATVELGGPEVVTMEELLRRVRTRLKGGRGGGFVKLPYGALRAALIAGQTVLRGRSPVAPGQLSSFARDGVAAPSAFWESWRARLADVDAMIAASESGG